VVGPAYLKQHQLFVNNAIPGHWQEQGKTVVFLLVDEKITAAMAVADVIKPQSKSAVRILQSRGVRCMMVTGDQEQVAQWVAHEVGLDEFFAGVLPDKKADKIKEVQNRGLKVAMVGDGINDAPALAQADIGIAIGAGSDLAVETADIILVRNNPQDVVSILRLSAKTHQKMVQNLAWATGYNVIAIPLAAGVLYHYGILLSPAVGALLMTVSTIIVAVNARLMKTD
jgi:Cu2+-exporting ATPase